ncbi:hypothetical protein DICA2_B06876 [Diutina catenulata]
MSGVPVQVTNWLYNVVQPQYVHKELVYNHVCQFLALHYKQNLDFSVKTRQYTDPHGGTVALLINLSGVIPSSVLSMQGNQSPPVPLDIWIPFKYPEEVPTVYASADHAHDRYLRANNNFDTQGRFYHPLLSQWYHNPYDSQCNLVALIDVVVQSMSESSPITTERPEAIAPVIPAKIATHGTGQNGPPEKPRKEPETTQSPQVTGNRQTSGPPVPEKPEKPRAPAQKPLPRLPSYEYSRTGPPLPPVPQPTSNQPWPQQGYQDGLQGAPQYSQGPLEYAPPAGVPRRPELAPQTHSSPQYRQPQPPYPQSPVRTQHQHNNAPPTQHVHSPPPQRPPHHHSHPGGPQQAARSHHRHTSSTASFDPNIIDTVIDAPAKGVSSSTQAIERAVASALPSVQPPVAEITQNHDKTAALSQQLSHHIQKAEQNCTNLESHIAYLEPQLASIESHNKLLQSLEVENAKDSTQIVTELGDSSAVTAVTDIVVPDSLLVAQLYDVVAEIKATKDCIALVSGKFAGASELVNDDNLDACVKQVRNMSRELFWLELTKNAIGEELKLH